MFGLSNKPKMKKRLIQIHLNDRLYETTSTSEAIVFAHTFGAGRFLSIPYDGPDIEYVLMVSEYKPFEK